MRREKPDRAIDGVQPVFAVGESVAFVRIDHVVHGGAALLQRLDDARIEPFRRASLTFPCHMA